MARLTNEELASQISSNDTILRRRALAQAITLCESSRDKDERRAVDLIEVLLPHIRDGFRVGLTGPPGVGKSTLVEGLGIALVQRGEHVAVLCIDPRSSSSGGALMADKSVMLRLSSCDGVFIRPGAGEASQRGVGRRTEIAIKLCQAAGYTVVIVETVGVGQNECEIASMTDMVALLQEPYGTSELQVLKRGIYENVDMILINKSDVALSRTREAEASVKSMLSIVRDAAGENWPGSRRAVPVRVVSALTGAGLDAVLEDIDAYRVNAVVEIRERRKRQDQAWIEAYRSRNVLQEIGGDSRIQKPKRSVS